MFGMQLDCIPLAVQLLPNSKFGKLFLHNSLGGHRDGERIRQDCEGVIWIGHAHTPYLSRSACIHCRVDGDHNGIGIDDLCPSDLRGGPLTTFETHDCTVRESGAAKRDVNYCVCRRGVRCDAQ